MNTSNNVIFATVTATTITSETGNLTVKASNDGGAGELYLKGGSRNGSTDDSQTILKLNDYGAYSNKTVAAEGSVPAPLEFYSVNSSNNPAAKSRFRAINDADSQIQIGVSSSASDTGNQTYITSNNTLTVTASAILLNGLTYPSADGTAGQVLSTDGAGNIGWSSAGGGSTGDITFSNIQIVGTGTYSVAGSIELVPNSSLIGNGQYIIIRPTAAFDGNHIHIEKGANPYADLMLGDDLQYVKLGSTGTITVNTFDNSTGTAYTFSSAGMTFPDDTVQTTAYIGGSGGTPVYARDELPAGAIGVIITVSDSGSDDNAPAGNYALAYWDDDVEEWLYMANSNSVTIIV